MAKRKHSSGGPWFSLYLDTEIVFKIQLKEITRIKELDIRWGTMPKLVKIEYSQDNEAFDVGKFWYKLKVLL